MDRQTAFGLDDPGSGTFDPQTLIKLLRWTARQRIFTYRELDKQACAIGAMLLSMGAKSERVMLFFPPGLDYLAAFFGWLYVGAVAVPVKREQITTIHFVPPMLQVFVETEGVEQCNSLRQVICSGQALGVELQERFFARLGAALHNLYGPAEAAVDVTAWVCQPGLSSVPIGRPIANMQTFVLDAHLNLLPVGLPGELYIGGVGVGRGYWQRADLTAERFIPNPFSDGPGERLYRTGDRARFLADGHIEFLGRLDYQIKIRGFRIELGEVETALTAHPSLKEAVALAREEAGGDARLIAYVVANQGQTPGVGDLRNCLKERLPEYMIPSVFALLEKIPLLPNGKVDRRALPALATD